MNHEVVASVEITFKQHTEQSEKPVTLSQDVSLNYEGFKIFTDSLNDYKSQDIAIQDLHEVRNIDKSTIESIDIHIHKIY